MTAGGGITAGTLGGSTNTSLNADSMGRISATTTMSYTPWGLTGFGAGAYFGLSVSMSNASNVSQLNGRSGSFSGGAGPVNVDIADQGNGVVNSTVTVGPNLGRASVAGMANNTKSIRNTSVDCLGVAISYLMSKIF
jgi:hypothetical protein